jgi:hypothetical protein
MTCHAEARLQRVTVQPLLVVLVLVVQVPAAPTLVRERVRVPVVRVPGWAVMDRVLCSGRRVE